ncbi:putative OFR1a [Aphis citricidus meson-like virus]|uniref:OFR1a n=1 Tax=Aphis citricidus meson-like virus TaxID=2788946 RepID=A0AAE7TMR2_9NIDO|nr:putative OFR1a [Aphis citricidus meson-like virus]QPD01781.1 putative OFR1a [Aphis citricidus meson-like virus]
MYQPNIKLKLTMYNMFYLVLLAYFLYDLTNIYYKRSYEFNNLNSLGRYVWKTGILHKFIFISDILYCALKLGLILTAIRILFILQQAFYNYCTKFAKYNGPILPSGLFIKHYARILNLIFKFCTGSNLFYYADMLDTKHSRSYVITRNNILYNGMTKINGFCSTCYAFGHYQHQHERTYLSDMSIFIAKQCRIFSFNQLEQRYNPVLAAPTDVPQLFTFERVLDFFNHIETYFIPTQKSNQTINKNQLTVHNIIWPEPTASAIALTRVINGVVGDALYESTKFGITYVNTDNRIPHYILIKYNDNNLHQTLQRLSLYGVKDVTIYGSKIDSVVLENYGFRSVGVAHGNLDVFPVVNDVLYPIVVRNLRTMYNFSDITLAGLKYGSKYSDILLEESTTVDETVYSYTNELNTEAENTNNELLDLSDKSVVVDNSIIIDNNQTSTAADGPITRSDSLTSLSTVNTIIFDDIELITIAENLNALFPNKDIRLTYQELCKAYKNNYNSDLPNINGFRGKFLFSCGITKRNSNGHEYYKRNKFYNAEELVVQVRKFTKTIDNHNNTRRVRNTSIFSNLTFTIVLILGFICGALSTNENLATYKCENFKQDFSAPLCSTFGVNYDIIKQQDSLTYQLNTQTLLLLNHVNDVKLDTIDMSSRCFFTSDTVYTHIDEYFEAAYNAEIGGELSTLTELFRDKDHLNFYNPVNDYTPYKPAIVQDHSYKHYVVELFNSKESYKIAFTNNNDRQILYTHPTCITTCYCNQYSFISGDDVIGYDYKTTNINDLAMRYISYKGDLSSKTYELYETFETKLNSYNPLQVGVEHINDFDNIKILTSPVIQRNNKALSISESIEDLGSVNINYLTYKTTSDLCTGKYNKRTTYCSVERENLPLTLHTTYDGDYLLECLTFDDTCNTYAKLLVTSYDNVAYDEFKKAHPDLYTLPKAETNDLTFEDLYYLYLDDFGNVLVDTPKAELQAMFYSKYIEPINNIQELKLDQVNQHYINCEFLSLLSGYTCAIKRDSNYCNYYSELTSFNLYCKQLTIEFHNLLHYISINFAKVFNYIHGKQYEFNKIYETYTTNVLNNNPNLARTVSNMGFTNVSICSLYAHPDTEYIHDLCQTYNMENYKISYVKPSIYNIFYVKYTEHVEELTINSYYQIKDSIAYKLLDKYDNVVVEKFLARQLFYEPNTYTLAYSHVDNRLQYTWGLRNDYQNFILEDTNKVIAYTGFHFIDIGIIGYLNFNNVGIVISINIVFYLLTRNNNPSFDIATCLLTFIVCCFKDTYLAISLFNLNLNFILQLYGIATIIYTTIRLHDYYLVRTTRLGRDYFVMLAQITTNLLTIFNILWGSTLLNMTFVLIAIVLLYRHLSNTTNKKYWSLPYIKAPLASKIWNKYRDNEKCNSDEVYFNKISREFKYNIQNNNLNERTKDLYLLQEIYRHIIIGNSKGFHPGTPNLVVANYNVASESTINLKPEALTSNCIPYKKPESFQSNHVFEVSYSGANDGLTRSLGAIVVNNNLYILRHLLGETHIDFNNPDWNCIKATKDNDVLKDFNFAAAHYDGKQFWIVPVNTHAHEKYKTSITIYEQRVRRAPMYTGYAALWDFKLQSWISGYASCGAHDISTLPGLCGAPLFSNSGHLIGIHIASSTQKIDSTNPWYDLIGDTITTNYYTDILGNVPKDIIGYDCNSACPIGLQHPVLNPFGALGALIGFTSDKPNANKNYDQRFYTYFGIDQDMHSNYTSNGINFDLEYFLANSKDVMLKTFGAGHLTFLGLLQIEGYKSGQGNYDLKQCYNNYEKYRNKLKPESAIACFEDKTINGNNRYFYLFSVMEIVHIILKVFKLDYTIVNFIFTISLHCLTVMQIITIILTLYKLITENNSIFNKILKFILNFIMLVLLFLDNYHVFMRLIVNSSDFTNIFSSWLYKTDISEYGIITCYNRNWSLLDNNKALNIFNKGAEFSCKLNFCMVNTKKPKTFTKKLIMNIFGLPAFDYLCIMDIKTKATYSYLYVTLYEYLPTYIITYIQVLINYYFTVVLLLQYSTFLNKRFNKFKLSLTCFIKRLISKYTVRVKPNAILVNLKQEGVTETNKISTILNALTALVKFEQYKHLKPLQVKLLSILEISKDELEFEFVLNILREEFHDLYKIIHPLLVKGVSHEVISSVIRDGYITTGAYDLAYIENNLTKLMTTLSSLDNDKDVLLSIESKVEFDLHYNNIKSNLNSITRDIFDYNIDELINSIASCEGNEITDAFLEISTLIEEVDSLQKSKDNNYFKGRLNKACSTLRKLNNIYMEELKREELQAIKLNKKEQNRLADERARELTQRNKITNITRAMLIILNTIRVANLTDNKELILDKLDNTKREALIKLYEELNKDKYQQRSELITAENFLDIPDINVSYFAPHRSTMSVIAEAKGIFLWNDTYCEETLTICGETLICTLPHKHSITNCYKTHMHLYYEHLNECKLCFKKFIQRKHPRCGAIYTNEEIRTNPGYLFINHLTRWRSCKACITCSYCPKGTKQANCDTGSWHTKSIDVTNLFMKPIPETWISSNVDKGEMTINIDKTGVLKISDKSCKVDYVVAVPKNLNLIINNMTTHNRLTHANYNIYFKKNISDSALLNAYYYRMKNLIEEQTIYNNAVNDILKAESSILPIPVADDVKPKQIFLH